MNAVEITPIYGAIIALLMVVLSSHTGAMRGKHSTALGDGGISQMALSIRRFGNLAEYAAMAVLLLLLMELRGIAPYWLHAYGSVLVFLRLLHPFILFDRMDAPLWKKAGRFLAAGGTAAIMTAASIALLL